MKKNYCWMFGFVIIVWTNVLLASNIKIIEVPRFQSTFNVQLKDNHTTGYEWQLLKYNVELLQLENTVYKVDNPHLMGSPGVKIFTFKILQAAIPKSTTMIFKHARSFEQNLGVIQKIKIKFK